MKRNEGIEFLIARGQTRENAETFIDSKDIQTKGLQLPPESAMEVMTELTKMGLLVGPVRFYVKIPVEHERALLGALEAVSDGPVATEGTFDVANIGENPIGDEAARLAAGYSGDAGLAGLDKSKVH